MLETRDDELVEPAGAQRHRSAPGPLTAHVTGLGTALPARVVENATVAARLGVAEDWIERRTGIQRRHHVGDDEGTATLGAAAARAALADAGVDGATVDMVLVATTSADHITPATAPQVADLAGIHHAAAFDLGAACTGFVTGLATGSAFIESGRAGTIVVVGVEVMSRFLDLDDKRTGPLFGDGAGAVVLTARTDADDGCGVGPAVLGADGSQWDVIRCTREHGLIEMDGHATFVAAVNRLALSAQEACALSGVTLEDIDLFVFHQANARILGAVAERLSLPTEKVVNAIADIGNLSAASIPLALAHARRSGQLPTGARVLCSAFGAGLTWGACVMTWDAA